MPLHRCIATLVLLGGLNLVPMAWAEQPATYGSPSVLTSNQPQFQNVETLKQLLVKLHIQYEYAVRQNYQLQQQVQALRSQLPSTDAATAREVKALMTSLQSENKRLQADLVRLKQQPADASTLVRLQQENARLQKDLLAANDGSLDGLRERFGKAKTALEKASQTITEQNRRIALLTERMERLQTLQQETDKAITLTGQSETPEAELLALQAQLSKYEAENQSLKASLAKANSIASTNAVLAGGAVQLATPAVAAQRSASGGSITPEQVEGWLKDALSTSGSLSLAANPALPTLAWYNNSELIANYALYLKKENRLSEAESFLKVALVQKPTDESLFYNLGNLYLQQKKYSESETCYQQALALNPQYDKALYNLGLLYHQQGNKVKTKERLEAFLAINTNPLQRQQVQAFLSQL